MPGAAASGVAFLVTARDLGAMAEDRAADPAARRNLLVQAIVDHRRSGGEPDDGAVADADVGDDELVLEGAGRSVAYADRSLRLAVDDAERDRLEALCGEYRVFKVAQPATRRAPDGVVYLSAVTDAKHLADFLEAVFREVYGADADYELRIA